SASCSTKPDFDSDVDIDHLIKRDHGFSTFTTAILSSMQPAFDPSTLRLWNSSVVLSFSAVNSQVLPIQPRSCRVWPKVSNSNSLDWPATVTRILLMPGGSGFPA